MEKFSTKAIPNEAQAAASPGSHLEGSTFATADIELRGTQSPSKDPGPLSQAARVGVPEPVTLPPMGQVGSQTSASVTESRSLKGKGLIGDPPAATIRGKRRQSNIFPRRHERPKDPNSAAEEGLMAQGDKSTVHRPGSSTVKEAAPNKGKVEQDKKTKKRTSLAQTILEPLGLYSRNPIDRNLVPNGIPRVTDFISTEPDGLISIFRRFDKLNVRNLLLLETKVAALEALQAKLDAEDMDNLDGTGEYNFAMASTHMSFEYFALLGEGRDVLEASKIPAPPTEPIFLYPRKSDQDYDRVYDPDYDRALTRWVRLKDLYESQIESRASRSSIPVYAFKEWDETRRKHSQVWLGKVANATDEDLKAGTLENRDERDRIMATCLADDPVYWRERWDVSQAIKHALKEYQEALVLQDAMFNLQRPSRGTVEALNKYFNGAKDQRVRPHQFVSQSAASTMLGSEELEEDFVSLHPPVDNDLGTRLVAKWFGWLLKRRGDTSPEFDDVSTLAVGRLTTIWTFLVAIGFLMGAVWFIWRVGLEEVNVEVKFERKLAILTAFTGLFGGWVALFTSAKRYEIFGATAAYAAVLIVFVGVDPGDAIGPGP